MKLEHAGRIFGKHISNFMKFRPVGAELFHEDRRDVSTSRCRNYAVLLYQTVRPSDTFLIFF